MDNMSTTATKLAASARAEREMMMRLRRNVERLARHNESLVKSGMVTLPFDFNEHFGWAAERIYKGNLRLEFINEVRKLLEDRESTIHGVRAYLRMAAARTAREIIDGDLYGDDANGAAALARRWTHEAIRDIHYIAGNLLENMTSEEE